METETVYSVEVQIDSLLGNPPSGVTDEKVKKSTFHNRVCVTSQETKLPGLKEIQPVITIKKIVLHKVRLTALFGPIRTLRLDISAAFLFLLVCPVLAKLFI